MLKFLLISDIHNNIAAVQKLRSQEDNSYDAVVVVGDIGNDNAQPIFDILSTFGCPVLYVYGNWDDRQDYNRSFGAYAHHLHISPFCIRSVSFVGFSGCSAAWGENPIAKMLRNEVEQTHAETISAWKAKKDDIQGRKHALEAEHANNIRLLIEAVPKRPYKRQVAALEKALASAQKTLSGEMDDFENSLEYRKYTDDAATVRREILIQNRKALSDCVANLGNGLERTVVVTHDRLFRTHEDFQGVPVFLFGHRHGFAHTTFRGAQHVNVSVLDRRVLLRPKVFGEGDLFGQMRNLNTGNYAVMRWSSNDGFSVERVDLAVDDAWMRDWKIEESTIATSAPCLPY